jgi:RNA-binding protein
MTERILPKEERLRLKARSHHLDPVVLLGAAGLSDAAAREIDRALDAHGLIKVRGPSAPREERERLFGAIAERLDAGRIQLIGRLMVLYRPIPSPDAAQAGARARREAPARPGAAKRPVAGARPRARAADKTAPFARGARKSPDGIRAKALALAPAARRPGVAPRPARSAAAESWSSPRGAVRKVGPHRPSGIRAAATPPLGRSLKRSERPPAPEKVDRGGRGGTGADAGARGSERGRPAAGATRRARSGRPAGAGGRKRVQK